jgi:hypothetical protein
LKLELFSGGLGGQFKRRTAADDRAVQEGAVRAKRVAVVLPVKVGSHFRVPSLDLRPAIVAVVDPGEKERAHLPSCRCGPPPDLPSS